MVVLRGRRRRRGRHVPPSEGNDASGLLSEPWGFFCWTNGMEIRDMTADDWPAVKEILEQGIATGQATFATEAPTWVEWDADHLPAPRLVASLDGGVAGWAALSPTSRRACYAGVVEDSVYVAERARG